MSSSNCCLLTCIQISQEAGQVVWYSHLFQNFPQFVVIHTVKGFGIVKKAREFQKNIYFCLIDYVKVFDCVDHHKLWKILKEMGIPDHLTCLLRNLYAGQEAVVRNGHGTTDCFQIRKGVCQGCTLSSCLFNLYAEYTMQNAGLDAQHKLESRFPGEISITSDMQMIPPLWQKVKKN